MKTFKETIKKNRLVISYDNNSESPREWSNLGYFITVDRNYNSPDKNETLERIIKETGEVADNSEDHIKRIKKEIKKEIGENVLAIYPITKYEHSGVSYSLGIGNGFDSSNSGFYIVTDKTSKEIGAIKKDFEKLISQELSLYNRWVNGENLEFILYDKNGEVEDSSCGFYEIEDIREHLPKEWENENLENYLI